jgi:hypothetical protein
MAELSSPAGPQDWSFADRDGFTERWNRANVLNLMRGASGAAEYQSIAQRTAFYNWFDQIREVQGHEVLWPGAAWIVASMVRNLDDPTRTAVMTLRRAATGRFQDSTRLIEFGRAGNKAIFDDAFARLKELFERGLRGQKLTGAEALAWDQMMVRREQFDVVHPVYQRFCANDPGLAQEIADLAAGSDLFGAGGVAIGNALDFKGDIMKAQDRYNHGVNVVVPFYKRFKAVIDQSRRRRQAARPDPSAGGMVRAG